MKRRFLKTIWILILVAVMLLPPLRSAAAAGFNYYTSIFVKKNPTKMEYALGESFDKSGMLIYGNRTKADGSKDQCDLGIDSLVFSPSKFTKTGTIKVTLTLNCMAASGVKEPMSTTLKVTVYDPNEGDPPMYWVKKIKAEATKTDYLVGDSFDKSTLTVWAYNEGDVPPGEEKWNCTKYVKKISPASFTKAGEQYVTVTANLTTQHSTADFTAKIKVKVYSPIEITKHPGDEIVDEGGSCGFTVKVNHADKCNWFFVKGKSEISVKDADSFFPGLKVSGAAEKHLKLSNVPVELNGWNVMCRFSNKMQTVDSNTASIIVNAKGAPEATPEPTEAPATKAPAAETPAPTEQPKKEATGSDPSAHTHSFDGVYRYNSIEHWLECSCGERTAVGNHVVAGWQMLTKPTKSTVGVRKGYCAVCGAEVIDSISYDEYQDSEAERDPMSWMLILGIALAGLACVGCVASFVIVAVKNKKRKHRE